MPKHGWLRGVDAVTVRVPDLDTGLSFYTGVLGHRLKWRDDAHGQAGLELPDSDCELVLTTEHASEPNWLVESVDDAIDTFTRSGGTVLAEPRDIPIGRVAVVADPFGNPLVLVDLSRGDLHDRRRRSRHRRGANETPRQPLTAAYRLWLRPDR